MQLPQAKLVVAKDWPNAVRNFSPFLNYAWQNNRSICFKCLGIIVSFASKNDFIKRQLRLGGVLDFAVQAIHNELGNCKGEVNPMSTNFGLIIQVENCLQLLEYATFINFDNQTYLLSTSITLFIPSNNSEITGEDTRYQW